MIWGRSRHGYSSNWTSFAQLFKGLVNRQAEELGCVSSIVPHVFRTGHQPRPARRLACTETCLTVQYIWNATRSPQTVGGVLRLRADGQTGLTISLHDFEHLLTDFQHGEQAAKQLYHGPAER